ncbi:MULTISPECIES: helix-turn-helix domain-containing protein [Bacillus cereus group]|uniref:HTH cro/C1-type domain-containing protein n=1 Tax=Bacillus cereus ISP2954 TaxID=1053215 RepID=A0A9W5QFV5_BACCE|nr:MULTISPECIES: helix-turn-helix transcriptional regulator [Bacillus cereus group]AHZ54581.1 XRE family transcriptional regulator [Bacillus thuringiensis serovar kurstaki str. YBT-1520]AIE37634.1 XRE family transcriptional regulator [Bacillus thuringiensis serovar kurstaki str. HD-1]AIM35012.1 putative transcriptional regulator [Bacillus thuringiensis serovar kurstaki str. YBT-1520]AJK37602.1 helix-turn-helix family protein [Bacillus thuringiensis serovar kurstaki]AKJ62520.1 XRE family transc
MKTFGNIIRDLRKQKGITQKELAQSLKLSESTIGMYERNERQPDYNTLIRIADYFNVSTDFLLGRDSNVKADRNNKELDQWLNDIKLAPSQKREELKRFWNFIMQEEK